MLRYLTLASPKNMPKFYYLSLRNFTKLYTKEHEWITVEKGVATLGITDYAQSELGEIVHVDLPKIGDRFKPGESLGAVESVKTAADIYSPIDGIVQEVNDKLTKSPSLLNTHAESQGWYAKLKVEEEKIKEEFQTLMSAEQYEKYVQEVKK